MWIPHCGAKFCLTQSSQYELYLSMFKEGSAVPFFPKIQTLHALRALEGDHLSPHKSVPYSPEKIIQPHLFDIFTLKYDLRTFVAKKCRESQQYFLPVIKFCWKACVACFRESSTISA